MGSAVLRQVKMQRRDRDIALGDGANIRAGQVLLKIRLHDDNHCFMKGWYAEARKDMKGKAMDIISYHHNLDDQILVKLRSQDKTATLTGNVERWLKAIEGILTVQHNDQKNELLIFFDRQRIDALTILNLLGYAGPFIGARQPQTMPEVV